MPATRSRHTNREARTAKMRLFIGVELSDDVRSRAASIADTLREKLGPRVTARWIAAENLHVTLWFIGEVAEDRAAAIMSAVQAPFPISSFELEFRGAGAFPPHGAPRVLWIGIGDGQASMRALSDEIAARLPPPWF